MVCISYGFLVRVLIMWFVFKDSKMLERLVDRVFRSAVIGCHPVSSVPAPLPVAPGLLHSSWSSDIKSPLFETNPQAFSVSVALTLASNQFSPACTTKTSDFICYIHINVLAFNRYGPTRNIINWKSLRRWSDVHLLYKLCFSTAVTT
jgi:hypothetical protein